MLQFLAYANFDRPSYFSGSRVTWTNADRVGHTATAGTPKNGPTGQFDTDTIAPEESKSLIVQAKGGQSIPYYCTIHPYFTLLILSSSLQMPATTIEEVSF